MRILFFIGLMMPIFGMNRSIQFNDLPPEIKLKIVMHSIDPDYSHVEQTNNKRVKLERIIIRIGQASLTPSLVNHEWHELSSDTMVARHLIKKLIKKFPITEKYHAADELFYALAVPLDGFYDYFLDAIGKYKKKIEVMVPLIRRINLLCLPLEKQWARKELYDVTKDSFDLLLNRALVTYNSGMTDIAKLATVAKDRGYKTLSKHLFCAQLAYDQAESTTQVIDCMNVLKTMHAAGIGITDDVMSYMLNADN